MFRFWGFFLLLFLTPLVLQAAEVLTNDGQTFVGKILEEQTDYVLMEIENGVQVKIDRSQIVYVKKEEEGDKSKRDYPLLGVTFGDPAVFNGVAGYCWDDLGFKLSGGDWGNNWGVQLNLFKALTGKDPFQKQAIRDFTINFSLVGGLVGNNASTKPTRWSNTSAAAGWVYGGIGLDFNVSGLFFEIDGVTGNFPNNYTFPFQIGYVHRFN